MRGVVTSVSAAGSTDGRLVARVLVANASEAWRLGATGEARVVIGRSDLFGAVWWGIRKRLREDILL
jgi:hypothetical protein